ncbi:MAG: sortase [Firmicutes bacterium]|nr:sortase [Bacillota bacterium]MBQ1400881.1 sortase [Bacillota bacterium]
MTVTSGKKKVKLIVLIIALAAAAVLIWAGCRLCMDKMIDNRVQTVLTKMETMIPGFGDDAGQPGAGRDPLAAISIEGVDIVGCLEIPSLDLKAPVTAKNVSEKGFPQWVDGSPVKGGFRITGSHSDVFSDLADAKPGAEVTFTDVDGIRYKYKVTTQYHLKDWDEAGDDLVLCYESDEKTDFVLGCMTDL